jgi:hypothetical protein
MGREHNVLNTNSYAVSHHWKWERTPTSGITADIGSECILVKLFYGEIIWQII